MRYLVLMILAVLATKGTDYLVDWQFEEPGYSMQQVEAMDDLVNRVSCADWLCELDAARRDGRL